MDIQPILMTSEEIEDALGDIRVTHFVSKRAKKRLFSADLRSFRFCMTITFEVTRKTIFTRRRTKRNPSSEGIISARIGAPGLPHDDVAVTTRDQHAVKKLLRWARRFGRHFPWRESSDPYSVLVAEKLLQQTAARNIVVHAYQELLRYCPTPTDLSNADLPVLEKIVRPLGFAYRAKELKALGQALVYSHYGQVPNTLEELLTLPGVGDYAARAVISFALGADVPIVDTNVARFLHRFYGITAPIPSNPARKRSLLELAQSLVPKGHSREFNFAVLDLCATICKAGRPLCESCPVRDFCAYGIDRFKGPPGVGN